MFKKTMTAQEKHLESELEYLRMKSCEFDECLNQIMAIKSVIAEHEQHLVDTCAMEQGCKKIIAFYKLH